MDMLKEKVNDPKTKKILKKVAIGFLVVLVVDFATFIICFTNDLGPFNENNNNCLIQETVK